MERQRSSILSSLEEKTIHKMSLYGIAAKINSNLLITYVEFHTGVFCFVVA